MPTILLVLFGVGVVITLLAFFIHMFIDVSFAAERAGTACLAYVVFVVVVGLIVGLCYTITQAAYSEVGGKSFVGLENFALASLCCVVSLALLGGLSQGAKGANSKNNSSQANLPVNNGTIRISGSRSSVSDIVTFEKGLYKLDYSFPFREGKLSVKLLDITNGFKQELNIGKQSSGSTTFTVSHAGKYAFEVFSTNELSLWSLECTLLSEPEKRKNSSDDEPEYFTDDSET